QFDHIFFYFLKKFLIYMLKFTNISLVKRISRLILHDMYIICSQTITAEVGIKNDLFLKHHGKVSGLRKTCEELLFIFKTVNAFPASARIWLHIGRKSYIFKYPIPVKGKIKVSERVLIGIGWPVA